MRLNDHYTRCLDRWFHWILLMLIFQTQLSGDSLTVSIDSTIQGRTISSYLVGLHQVYTFTPDNVFADGELAAWVRRSGVSTSRFPGGTTVKHWDWENPTGQPFINSLDPEFDPSLNPPESEWMSLDEFIEFCELSSLEPFFGVNASTGSLYDLEDEGIAKAVRMVRYVKERGFGGGLWYIGNEEAHHHGGTVGYAKVFRRYADAMKAEDPDIRIFWNANNPSRNSIHSFLANDGGTADGLETHGKWPYGGDPDLPPASFEEWLDEVPLRDRKNGDKSTGGRRWRFAADSYRDWAREVGRELLIANNEYGLGKSQNMTGFNRYTTGLLMTEMLMEHFIGDWFATCFWDLTRGAENGLLDPQNSYRRNPFHIGMNMLADCQGGKFLESIPTSIPSVHGFSSKKDDSLVLYLLNKTPEQHTIRIEINGNQPEVGYGRQMQNSVDQYGQIVTISVNKVDGKFHATLPSFSFTEFVFPASGVNLKTKSLLLSNHDLSIICNSIPGLPFDVFQSTNLENWSVLKANILPDNFWTELKVQGDDFNNTFFRIQYKP